MKATTEAPSKVWRPQTFFLGGERQMNELNTKKTHLKLLQNFLEQKPEGDGNDQ